MMLQNADSSAAKFARQHVQLTGGKIFNRYSDRADIIPLTPNHFQHWIIGINCTLIKGSD